MVDQAKTQADESSSATLIAPHEIRELIARLTERSVEGMTFDEPRTLAGLAIDTGIPVERLRSALLEMQSGGRRRSARLLGIAALVLGAGLVGALDWHRMSAKPVATPPIPAHAIVQTDPLQVPPQPGLVSLAEVTYGPDAGNLLVDPTFRPPHPLPPGLSVYVTIGNLLWGAGDAHAEAIRAPLDPATEKSVREDVVALVKFARSRAHDFGLKHVSSVGGSAYYPMVLGAMSYLAPAMIPFQEPVEGKNLDQAASGAEEVASSHFMDAIQHMLRLGQQWHSDSGPQ